MTQSALLTPAGQSPFAIASVLMHNQPCDLPPFAPRVMEMVPQVLQFIANSMDGRANLRQPAVAKLLELRKTEWFGSTLLTIIEGHGLAPTQVDVASVNSAAVNFKNVVKGHWDPRNDVVVNQAEKQYVRQHIFSLLLRCKHKQSRETLMEAVRLICMVDYPNDWPQFVDMVVEACSDRNCVRDALYTAHEVFSHRYRNIEALTPEAVTELLGIHRKITKPLILLLDDLTRNAMNDGAAVDTVNAACEVFHDLNALDLGQEVDNNIKHFVDCFIRCLDARNPNLLSGSAGEAGPLAKLQGTVIELISLLVGKYDEEMEPYVQHFAERIYEFLKNADSSESYDDLVIRCLDFLTVTMRTRNRKILSNAELQSSLCLNVIVPNLRMRDSDIELFFEEPESFVAMDIEGSDGYTRRRSSCQLITALMEAFPKTINKVFTDYIGQLIDEYNKKREWQQMDLSIYLVSALAVKGTVSSAFGAQALNDIVPIAEFFSSHILPEFSDHSVKPPTGKTVDQVDHRAIVKAAVIKFVALFRHHLPLEQYDMIMRNLTKWLQSPYWVVTTYAAHTIERMIRMNDGAGHPRVTPQSLVKDEPMLPTILEALVTFLKNNKMPNEYVIQCLARVMRHCADFMHPYVAPVVLATHQVLANMLENPGQPSFNHNVFEALSMAIKCSPTVAADIEQVLWQTLIKILVDDVAEFLPYALQILAQLLDHHPAGTIPPNYINLFTPLTAETLYEQKGNIPAITRFIASYIRQGSMWLYKEGHTEKVLMVYQRLLQSKQLDHEGFMLLTMMLRYYPAEGLDRYLPECYRLIFARLSQCKTAKFVRCVILLTSVFVILRGASALYTMLEEIQQGIFGELLLKIWLPNVQKVNGHVERKTCIVALTKLVCECPQLMHAGEPWVNCITHLYKLMAEAAEADHEHDVLMMRNIAAEELKVQAEMGYTNVFCQLLGAIPPKEDPCKEITDVPTYVKQNLQPCLQKAPPQLLQLLRTLGRGSVAAYFQV